MKTNRKTHHRGVLSDSAVSAPIAMLLALLLIASTALAGGRVLAQSNRKPTGGRRAQVKPSSAVVLDERDPHANAETLAQLANDKLTELKGIRIDYSPPSSRMDWSRGPGGPVDPPGEMTMAASFKEECDVPLLILAAKQSRVSYVQNFKLDESALDLLPPSLSFTPVGELEEAADAAERKGLSWKKFKPGLKVPKKGANWIAVEEPRESRIALEIKAFGDFNGDGIEDDDIEQAAAKVLHTGPNKLTKAPR